MSGAVARAMALVTAHVKATSPGIALIDDELDSSSKLSYGPEEERRRRGRPEKRRHDAIGIAEKQNNCEAMVWYVRGGFVSGENHRRCLANIIHRGEYLWNTIYSIYRADRMPSPTVIN